MPNNRQQVRLSAYDQEEVLLDEVNLRILTQLQDSPRLPMAELARRIGMSAPAVTERVQRLERAGVIAGYRLDIDPAAVGLPVTAFTRIRPMPGSLPKIAELAAELPEVTECYRITGEDCFLIKVRVAGTRAMRQLLQDKLGAIDTIRSTRSTIVLDTVKETSVLPPPLTGHDDD